MSHGAPLLLAVLVLGCGDASEPERTSSSGQAPAESASATSGGPQAKPWVTRHPDGTFDVRVDGVPRTRVFEALASAAEFGIVPGRGAPAPRRITLQLDGVSADAAIRAVLAGVPHHVHYERAPAGGPVELRRVTLGLLPPPEARGEGRARLAQRLLERRRTLARQTPEEVERLRLERRERLAERRARIESLQDSPVDEDRGRAASLMKPDEDLDTLVDYLLEDESADVRERAAESLADAAAGEDAITAAAVLTEALSDPEPQVVAAAVSALEDVHDTLPDAAIRRSVRALEGHPDPRVRDAVDDFIRWTEE